MVCCASNGIMKPEKVKELIDLLSVMGYNLLELCIDDIYKIDGEPYFGYLRGGYTKEEVREMDEYAKSKGVELVPCIQVLAHLVNLVKIDRDTHLLYVAVGDTGVPAEALYVIQPLLIGFAGYASGIRREQP